MRDKRYQVFISSTFEDLKTERRAVQDVVISTGDFPAQMESFPAADEDQFEFIKSLIDKCDYYVLIIAGRYGTVADDGLSYTHKEFRYAVSQGVPILVMLHSDRGKIAADKTEETSGGKKRLADFIGEAEKGRLRKTWDSIDGLKLAVREALDHAIATKPRTGWVRGDTIASIEALEELNEVRKENTKFKKALGELGIELPLPAIPSPDEQLEIDLLPHGSNAGYDFVSSGSHAKIRATWIAFFPVFFSNLKWRTNEWNGEEFYDVDEDNSCVAIGSAFASEVSAIDTENCFKISKGTLDRLSSYYIEIGLMFASGAGHPFTEVAEKFARRHMIGGGSDSAFSLVSGKIEIGKVSREPISGDDEIPF